PLLGPPSVPLVPLLPAVGPALIPIPTAPAASPPPPAPAAASAPCARVGGICHAFLRVTAPLGTVLVGPCPQPLANCAEFTIVGSFTVDAVITALVPGTLVTLLVPV